MSKVICLTDIDGQVRWFKDDELLDQLAKVDMLPSGAMKSMITKFVTDVRNMLDEQQLYFKAQHGSNEKTRLLNSCKRLEGSVRDKCKHILPTIEKLGA